MHMNMLRQSLMGTSLNRGAAQLTALPMRLRSYGGLKD
jgi:hypothetical protein